MAISEQHDVFTVAALPEIERPCALETGPLWPVATGPEAYPFRRDARPVYDHPIHDTWYDISTKIYTYLDSCAVEWTTIDPVRFVEPKIFGPEKVPGPLHLWIGVKPRTLLSEDAEDVANGCKFILADANFPDVEIAFRESIVTRSVGPRLREPLPIQNPLSPFNNAFSPILGVRISPKNTDFDGTGALYLRKSPDNDEVMLLTNRHVALPLSVHENALYDRRNSFKISQHIVLLSSSAYTQALEKAVLEVNHEAFELQGAEEAIESKSKYFIEDPKLYQNRLARAKTLISRTEKWYKDITINWTLPAQRTLGHVVYSPPLSVSVDEKQYSIDWALIEINQDKIDWEAFPGNMLSVGEKINFGTFASRMRPHATSGQRFPRSGFLQLQDVIPEEDLRKPKELDDKGEPCLTFMKNGGATSGTIGRASALESIVREEYGGVKCISRHLAIYRYDSKDGPFSAVGDSGAVVVDGSGRIAGMITGGSGKADEFDVTYATPFWWLEQQIKQAFPDCFLYPAAK
ncbi:hypothetical protein H0H93_001823 [Arthromyces matolae]|nr:hypothetical protein H0H93_001823 [Arthromyces matolae]